MNIQNTELFQRLLMVSPFSAREMVMILLSAPDRYKDHYIEKRNGRGKRMISQPTAEVKYLQRQIIKHEFNSLELSPAAVGYRLGKSIKNHAAPHAPQRYLLKLDFKDFFPSLDSDAIVHCLRRDTKFHDEELWILVNLLCRRDRETNALKLSIGAPSSPFVSNYLMLEFDAKVLKFCEASQVVYTRYADDLAFSTSVPHFLDEVYSFVKNVLKDLNYLHLSLNDHKTVNVSTKNRRSLVGLNLANQGSTSIGRDAKRGLRAAMHNMSKGMLQPADVAKLRGRLAFVYSVDPEFVLALCKKYGYARVSDIAFMRAVA